MKKNTFDSRRRFPRVETSVEVNYDHGVESFREYTLNVSQSGLYIRTDRPLEMDSVITADFTLPDFDHSFRLNGKVVWRRHHESDEGPPGMGIAFESMDEGDKDALIQFIVQSQLTKKG